MNKLSKLYNKILEVFEDKIFDTKYFIADQVDKVRYWWKTCVVLMIVSVLLIWVGFGWLALEKEVVKITDKGNKILNTKNAADQERKDLYFIYTESITFKMEDNLFYLQFDTSDDYGKIKVGKCYKIWSLGMRVGMLDWYENILYFDEIECSI